MKDIPGIFWILALAFVAGVGLLIYSRSEPYTVPQVLSAWDHVEGFRQNLEYRRVNMTVGSSRENVVPPYRLIAQRLADAERPAHVARYILRIRLLDSGLELNPWLQDGLDVGLIDTQPGNVLGSVRLVAVRKLETQ